MCKHNCPFDKEECLAGIHFECTIYQFGNFCLVGLFCGKSGSNYNKTESY